MNCTLDLLGNYDRNSTFTWDTEWTELFRWDCQRKLCARKG